MKTVILIRHGNDNVVDLTPYGVQQMRRAGEWIKRHLPGKWAVVSGTSPHLVKSANTISEVLATRDGQFKELDAPGKRAKDVRSIAHIVDSWEPGCDVLVMVTNLPVVRDFGHYYILGRFRQRTIQEQDLVVDTGGALVLDLETARYTRLSPYDFLK